MNRQALPNWEKYWSKYHNREELLDLAENIDNTLLHIEKEFGVKLLSGDHMMLLDALDERIDDLEKLSAAKESPLQTSLFDDF